MRSPVQEQGEDGVRDEPAPALSPGSDCDAALTQAGREGLGPSGDRISDFSREAGDREVLTCV